MSARENGQGVTTATRVIVCFVLLPCLPLVTLFFVPEGELPVVQDRIAVAVIAAVVAGAASAFVAFLADRTRVAIAGYGIATAVLTVVPVFALIFTLLWINCGGGDTSGAC